MITDETQAFSALPHSVVWCVWSPVQYLSSCVWRQGGGCYHRVICPVLTRCLKWLLRDFFSPFDYFWRVILVWFCYGLYIMNTNIPRLFIFIKNKAVLYIRTSFIFHSVCRLSNSFPSSMSQCRKSRNGIVIKRLFFFCPTYLIAISLRPSSAIRAIRYWHTSCSVTDTHSNGSLWKNRGRERKKDGEYPSSQPLLCLTLCRYGFTQTLLLIRSLGWQTLRQRAAVCSVIHSYTQVSFLRLSCVRVETHKQPRRSQCCLAVITPPWTFPSIASLYKL